jgi:hypothetical protein
MIVPAWAMLTLSASELEKLRTDRISGKQLTCPTGHFMTEHTGVTEVLQSVRTWENETTIVATTPWIEPIALETAAYSDGAR